MRLWSVGSPDGRLGECWVLEVVGGELVGDGVGGGVVGELGVT